MADENIRSGLLALFHLAVRAIAYIRVAEKKSTQEKELMSSMNRIHRGLSSFLGLMVCLLGLQLSSPAQGTIISGYFEGRFTGSLRFYPTSSFSDWIAGGGLDVPDARIYFAFDTALAPVPSCSETSCRWNSFSGDGLISSQWLYAAFDFGDLKGSMVPGTSTDQSLSVNARGDSVGLYVTGPWATTFGPAYFNINSTILLDDSAFRSLDPISWTGHYKGGGIGMDDRGIGGIYLGDGGYERWSIELILFSPRSLTMFVVPEPSTIALLGLGLAGLAFTRRRKQ